MIISLLSQSNKSVDYNEELASQILGDIVMMTK